MLGQSGTAFAASSKIAPYQAVTTSSGVVKKYKLADVSQLSGVTSRTVATVATSSETGVTPDASLNGGSITGAVTMTFWYYNGNFLCASVFLTASDSAAATMLGIAELDYGGHIIDEGSNYVVASSVSANTSCDNVGTGTYAFAGYVYDQLWTGSSESAYGDGYGTP